MDPAAREEEAPAETQEDLGPDPREVSIQVFEARMKQGRTQDDAQAESINVLVNAAMRGDKRVVWTEEGRQEELIRRMREGF
jgi:hypothetical protein